MKSYTLQKDEHEKVPDDAQNLRLTRDIDGEKIITFQSDTGPIEENADDAAELKPQRKTPWEGDN